MLTIASHKGSISVTIDIVDRKSSQKKNDPKYPLAPMDEKISSMVKSPRVMIFIHMNASSASFDVVSNLMSSPIKAYTVIKNISVCTYLLLIKAPI